MPKTIPRNYDSFFDAVLNFSCALAAPINHPPAGGPRCCRSYNQAAAGFAY